MAFKVHTMFTLGNVNFVLCSIEGGSVASQNLTPSIQSLDRGLILLEAVAWSHDSISLPQLAQHLDIDRSSVFRLVNTLVRRGYLTQTPGKKDYVLGSTIRRIANRFKPNELLIEMAREYVAKLAEETGETTHLVVRNGRHAFFVDCKAASHRVGVSASAGSDDPLYCTSVGKSLLADFDRQALIDLYGEGPLPAPTSQSIRSIDELVSECQRTRSRGFAIDDEEAGVGVRCVGAPIRDLSASIVAAIGISAPMDRLSKRRCLVVGQLVRRIAADISEKLGYKSSSVA